MAGVSAEPLSIPMDCVSWSFFSDRAECYESKSSPVRGIEIQAMNFFPQSPTSETASSRFFGCFGNQDARESYARSVCLGGSGFSIGDYPDPAEGLMLESGFENFDMSGACNVSCSVSKDGDGVRGITIPMSSSVSNGNGALVGSPGLNDAITALQKYLPCNNEEDECWPGVDAYSCDEFRMYEFKVRRCMRGRSHDWTECPFAHPGEKARRRDPRRFHYSGTACPDFRKGSCRRGDACEFAHGVFECWLHPARYRTQPCKDGRNCRRRVCFFAHTAEQLRLVTSQPQHPSNVGTRTALHASALKNSVSGGSHDGSLLRHSFDGAVDVANHLGFLEGAGSPRGHMPYFGKASQANLCSSVMSSPTSTLVGHSHSPPPLSPPLSPSGSPPLSPGGISRSPLPAKAGYLKAILSPSSFAQVQSSLTGGNLDLANANVTLGLNVHATSPVSASRRHLDRMGSIPSITIPSVSSPRSSILSQSTGSHQSSSPVLQSSKVMTELLNSLQHLELNGSAVPAWLQTQGGSDHNLPRASHLGHRVQSFPYTPANPRWVDTNCEVELMEEPVQRVESGRDLRAKIYGRLTRENLQESSDSPDLGWVNELVK